MERLKVQNFDIVFIHDVEFGDLDMIINETIPALQVFKKRGITRYIGFSALPLKSFKYILDRVPTGSVDCIMNYCHFTLHDTSLVDMLPYFEEKQVGVINASPISMGLLTEKAPDWHPASEELKAAAQQASEHCKSLGYRLPDICIRHIAREKRISSTLVSMVSKEQVKQNFDSIISGLSQS